VFALTRKGYCTRQTPKSSATKDLYIPSFPNSAFTNGRKFIMRRQRNRRLQGFRAAAHAVIREHARRRRIHPTIGNHSATSTSPGDTKTGDRMHNEKSRTAWSHCQQGLPCLSAVAPTLSGAFHAPHVKSETVRNHSLNAMEASSTAGRFHWRSSLTQYDFSCPRSPMHILVCQPGAIFASSFVTPAFASPLLPLGMRSGLYMFAS